MAVTRQASEQPQCGGSRQPQAYNTGLQVMGLFLILALSALSCSFPLAVKRFTWIPVPRRLLFICRHLGTGVIIATSFVHLVPTAFTNLLDPCLPEFWTTKFPAMPGVIIMLGALVISGIEMIFASRKLHHSHQSELTNPANPDAEAGEEHRDSATEIPDQNEHDHDVEKNAGPNNERLFLQCTLLEAGILFHSIFIGMAIAFSKGMAFVVLLIAISFHQIFEGLALGSRIAAIDKFGRKSLKPWFMALAYGVTAPLGQAIGLGVHGTFSLDSQNGLLMVGITNAFSSGLLIYAGLVQLFYEDFLSERSLHGKSALKGKARIGACIAFVVGVVGMSLVGAWA